MNKFLVVGLVYLLLGCGFQKRNSENSIKNSGDKLSKNDMKSTLEYLASDELEGRKTGTQGIEKAAVYIENVFKKNKIKPYFETYRDSFNLDSIVGYNIVGYLEGNDPKLKKEFIILGAHYDHIGTAKAVNVDTIANGANDDASGTVAVLEWAKHFSKTKNNKRGILFTLYSAEEMGLKGSEHLANRMKATNTNLYAMVNFEMIGVPLKDRDYSAFLTGYDVSNMANVLNGYVGEKILGKSDIAMKYELFKRSDNYPFYELFKVPCQTISSCDLSNFDYYHHVDDEADKIDYKHMANFLNQIIPALEGMINAPTKEIKLNNE
ncbi:M28 family peptidase [Flavobacteriaceae bacterium SZ-1-7]|uniref:M28 family peptidase n=1 Tax=Tamlana sedimenti TaxID=3134126 RepID=UPI00312723B5